MNTEAWVVILAARDRRIVDEASFVLGAVGIEHELGPLDGAWQLSVPASSAARAADELAAYRAELAVGRQHGPVRLPELEHGWTGIVAYAAVLLFVAVVANQDLYGYDWSRIGRLDVDRVRDGEWWRTVTALCLHVDTGHLAGNLAFGGFFGLYAGRYLGSGLAWLGILVGGMLGNALNVLVQPPGHLAVGASTAVFAALGMLAAYTWRRGYLGRTSWRARAAPLTAALGLLAFTGTGGGAETGNVDIMAHLMGFVAGIAIGVLLAASQLSHRPRIQGRAGAAALAILLIAWACALTAA